jgi:hypothetical protein
LIGLRVTADEISWEASPAVIVGSKVSYLSLE